MNLPETCEALRDDLNSPISACRGPEPATGAHPLIKAARFCRFLEARADLAPAARAANLCHARPAPKLSRRLSQTAPESVGRAIN